MSILSDKILADARSYTISIKIKFISTFNRILILFRSIFSKINFYILSRQNEILLKKRYVDLAKYIHTSNNNDKKTDFSHDNRFDYLLNEIDVIQSFIDDTDKK